MVTRSMSVLPRDQSLDSELESGAHMTLILVATGLAFLFTGTAIIFYLFPICRVMRRTLFPKPLVDDSTQVRKLTNQKRVFQPTMTSTPMRQLSALPQRLNQPSYQPEPRTIHIQRYPAILATRIPRYPVALLHQPNPSCNGPPGFYDRRVSPPNQSHTNHYRSRLALATLPPPLPSAHINIVSPHIAGWMKIADDVVGRHPFAKPLFERMASQAEIELISDHVQIRWAHGAKHSQPTPVKVLGPTRDTPTRPDHLELGAIAENTRREFSLRDQGPARFEHHVSPPLAVSNDDSTTRSERNPVSQSDHSQKSQKREYEEHPMATKQNS